MSTARLSHGLDDEFLQAIGLVAVHWSSLEALIDAILARLLKTSAQQTHALTAGIGLPFRLDMIAGLAELIPQKSRRELLEEIIADIRKVLPDRNFAIHAMWVGGIPAHGHMLRRTASKVRLERWDAKRVVRVADEIARIQLRILDWQMLRPLRGQRILPYTKMLLGRSPQNRGAVPRGRSVARRRRPPRSSRE
jgi:AcrR family transcriptional regulator